MSSNVAGSRCFTISLVLRGRKAVSAQAMRSSNAAPSSSLQIPKVDEFFVNCLVNLDKVVIVRPMNFSSIQEIRGHDASA